MNSKTQGYLVVIVMVLACGAGYGSSGLFGIFLANMMEELGSFALYIPTIATLTGIILGLFTGKVVERTSLGITTFVGVLGSSLMCLFFSRATGSIGIIAGAVALGLCIAYGMFSTIPLAVNEWFYKDRAKVTGAAIGSLSIMGIIVLFVGTRMYSIGWRPTYTIFAIVNAILAVLVLLIVKTPAQRGMKPYGYEELGGVAEEGEEEDPSIERPGFMLVEALKTPAFWLVALGGWMFAVMGEGIASYLPTMLTTETSTGVDIANTTVVIVQVGAFAGGFLAGAVAERFGNKAMTLVLGIFLAVGFIVVSVVYPGNISAALLVIASILLGLGFAAYGNITPQVCAECFGTKDYNNISPIYAMISQAGSCTCPFFVDYFLNNGGGITRFYNVGIVISLVAIVLIILGINFGPMRKQSAA